MKIQVFAVFDNKIASYAQPFFSPTVSGALRSFADAAHDPNMMLAKHPDDFSLFHIGEFDDESGFLDPLPAPLNLGLASTFIRKGT